MWVCDCTVVCCSQRWGYPRQGRLPRRSVTGLRGSLLLACWWLIWRRVWGDSAAGQMGPAAPLDCPGLCEGREQPAVYGNSRSLKDSICQHSCWACNSLYFHVTRDISCDTRYYNAGILFGLVPTIFGVNLHTLMLSYVRFSELYRPNFDQNSIQTIIYK